MEARKMNYHLVGEGIDFPGVFTTIAYYEHLRDAERNAMNAIKFHPKILRVKIIDQTGHGQGVQIGTILAKNGVVDGG